MDAAIKILAIGIGGAFGAIARHLINISPVAGVFARFPLPTFLINVTGSFLIGFCLILFTDRVEINENLRMAIIVGFLGAFTTFSTFEMEIFGLVREREFVSAGAYVIASVVVGFAGVIAGVELARRL